MTHPEQRIEELESKLKQASLLIEICQQLGACNDINESLELLLEYVLPLIKL